MLTLKQARRMVAKSRRRVWRLARLYGYSTWVAAGVNRTGVALNLAESVNHYSWGNSPRGPAFHWAAEELRTRWDRLRGIETIIGERKWAMARARAYGELPALDHGQDGDELLQDIADYYANIHPCPACGAEMERVECHECGGEGGRDGDALMEEDPLWYDLDDYEACSECGGEGYYWQCPNVPHGGGVMQVIYDNNGVAHVKLHETLYSPQALAALASRVVELEALVTNLRDTLSTVAVCGGNCADCRELAQLALDGRFGDA